MPMSFKTSHFNWKEDQICVIGCLYDHKKLNTLQNYIKHVSVIRLSREVFFLFLSHIQTKNNPLLSQGISVSIVYNYGLDDQMIRDWFPAEAKDFSSSLCVQTGYVAHPASYPVGSRCPFPGGKAWLGCDADYSSPSSAEAKNE
jgi:hypothetical protein